SYIPARIEWQLRLAMSEQLAGATEQARADYEQVKALATAALAVEHKSANPEAAWRFALAIALAGQGETAAAVEQAQQAIATLADANDALEGPGWQYYLAVTYAMTGNAAKALPILDRLLHRPSSLLTVELLKLDPIWDPLRQDAQFRSLLVEGKAKTAAVAPP
ncbi:tetratricopeptide repeat protein, partial [Nevskia sp.]|uniref:tetratricopeptide repeat protein n=1 Tax=Nevskia sp. TaxID=1929292 RepID=UPI0025DCC0A1